MLSEAGISSSLLQKVRFKGPVGKLALIAAIALIALGGVGVRSSNEYIQGLCVILAAIIALGIGGAVLWYSHKHPQEATLEGLELVVMQQQKAWAAKNVDLSKPSPTIPNPGGLAPQFNPPEVIEQ